MGDRSGGRIRSGSPTPATGIREGVLRGWVRNDRTYMSPDGTDWLKRPSKTMSEPTTSGYATPFRMMFEMQRSATEMGRRMLDGGRSIQRDVAEGTRTGLRTQEFAQQQAMELARLAAQNYLTAFKMTMPASESEVDEMKRSVDAQFDDLRRAHADAFDGLEANVDDYEELSEEYLETLQGGTRVATDVQRRTESETVRWAEELGDATERTSEAIAEGVEGATEATERATRASLDVVENATETAADAAEERPRTLSGRIRGIGDTYAEDLREAGIEALEDLSSAQAEAVAEATGVSLERAREWINRAGATYAQDVDLIYGIGEAHAEDLHAGGIETIADLAEAEADDVAELTGVSEDHAQEWIDDARSRQKEGIEIVDGIGERRAERLRRAGIETLADLAAADPESVAEAADVSAERAREWIDAAQA